MLLHRESQHWITSEREGYPKDLLRIKPGVFHVNASLIRHFWIILAINLYWPHSQNFPSLHLLYSSFSSSSVALPTSQLILQPFRCFTYVTTHSPTLLSPLLRHRIFTYVTWRVAHVTFLVSTWTIFILNQTLVAEITRGIQFVVIFAYKIQRNGQNISNLLLICRSRLSSGYHTRHWKSNAVGQAVACAPVTRRARVRTSVGTSFLGDVFSGFFLTCKTNVGKP